MQLAPEIREWLLATDPKTDPLGIRHRYMVEFVEELESELRDAGGPGSGNFGHAGRPGEVGGSAPSDESGESSVVYHKGGLTIRGGVAAMDFRRTVDQIPDALVSSTAKEIAIVNDSVAAERIDEYLLENYNFDLQGQALSMVDRTKATVIATKQTAPAAFARTLESRFLGKSWSDVVREATGKEREEQFVSAFSRLFGSKGFMFPIATMGNPISFAMEQVFHSWGWK